MIISKPLFAAICLFAFAAVRADEIQPGDTKEAVISTLGEPKGNIKSGDEEILVYERGEIVLRGGKVVKIGLMSEDELAGKQAAKQEEARERAAEAKKAQEAAVAALRNSAATNSSAASSARDPEKEKRKRVAEAKAFLEKAEKDRKPTEKQKARNAAFAQGMPYFIWRRDDEPIKFKSWSLSESPSVVGLSVSVVLDFERNAGVESRPVRIKLELPTKEGDAAYQIWEFDGEPDPNDGILAVAYAPARRGSHFRYTAGGAQKTQTWSIVKEFYPSGYHVSNLLKVQLLGNNNEPASDTLTFSITNAPAAN